MVGTSLEEILMPTRYLQHLADIANPLSERTWALFAVPLDPYGVALNAWYEAKPRSDAAQQRFDSALRQAMCQRKRFRVDAEQAILDAIRGVRGFHQSVTA